ncbi:MAG: FtsX-like permease family protein [Acidobacteria bacterium]|nr:FtsX-like permease family protein [Acidobacteriota bacterium]
MRRALRALLRDGGYAGLVVTVVALAVGANTAVFTVAYGALFAPLPYRAPGELVRVATQFPTMGFDKFWISAPEYLEYREWSASFAEAGAFNTGMASVVGAGEPFRAQQAASTASLFRTLGISAALGRVFTDAEDRPGAEPVLVLSDGLWRRAFGAAPDILGRRLTVDGVQRTVIGVLPPRVDLLDRRVEFWIPLALDPADLPGRGSHNYIMVARLAPGTTIEAARAELPALLERWRSESGDTHAPHPEFHPVILVELHEEVVGDQGDRLIALLALSALLLLAGCANLANLIVGRAESRRGDIALRAALGAGRAGAAGPFLREGILLSVVGGALGLGLAQAGVSALLAAYPGGVPRIAEIGISGPVLVFALLATGLTGVVFSAAPIAGLATAGRESQLLGTLQAGGKRVTGGRNRFRSGLVAFEVALSAALLIACLLLVRSLFAVQATDPGFDPENLSTYQTYLPETAYPAASEQLAFLERLRAEAASLPGVEAVTYMSGLPPRRRLNANDTALEGVPSGEGHPAHNMDYWQFAGPGYFEAMGIPLLSGRGFTPADDGGATPVAVVNRTAAELFWPGQDPIGRRLSPGQEVPWFTIIGVAGDVKQGGLEAETGTEVYFHYPQTAEAVGFAPRTVNVVVRSRLPASALAPAVRDVTRRLDPSLPVDSFRPMTEVIGAAVAGPRFLALLAAVFAALAVLLAAAGVFGVMSARVTEQTPELGVRMAFGAAQGELLALVFRQGMRVALPGLALGLVAAFAASRGLASILFGVAPGDAVSYLLAFSIVLGAAALACLAPAFRASRIQPTAALRHG